ncbi:hypothetical protein AAFF_G00144370 [Aldrovandia affinis]|uniref:RanBP-type and C3HC4-type zinc finger-containing protein 1 n=1 Tax=Aldrovandia affinis TaxID=143900 RepID=A0AAD7WX22_9TELE|nr:hypothetical protein AAFF_G00144370 [Aldrovandia affinis]
MAASEGQNLNALKEAEDLAQALSEALNCGGKEEAGRIAQQLAELNVPVSVRLSQEAYSQDAIKLKVGVEDAQSECSVHITMTVTPGITISDLKDKVNTKYGFHPSLQRWVIGKRLARDPETLCSHGVKRDGDQAFLYIQSAQAASLSREQHKQDEENRRLDGKQALCHTVTGIIETMERYSLEARGTGGADVRKMDKSAFRGVKKPPLPLLPKPPALAPPLAPKPPLGWSCPQCTYVNKPTRPGCEICGMERPATYKVPDIYQPDDEEVQRIRQEEVASLQYQQALVDERERNFMSLLETDEVSLVPYNQELDCPICYTTIPPGEGAILRECLHTFCKECLKGTITNSMDAEITCPYMDDNYTCDSKLQDREICSVLSQEEYQKFLELRLSIAETRSENSYHCKTPDCPGWCIFEDEVNEFACELCNETNCILCKAIHQGMNCKEYQDDLRLRAENDIAAKQTTDLLNTMLQTGEAMHCPKCKIIVQKKDGCDWICCVMCKTEMCWVTRQSRWGPKGHGDTSGGCKCRVNGPCHPNCQNCH